MRELRIVLSDSEYDAVQIKKNGSTYREILLDALGVTYKNRIVGRPKTSDQLTLEAEEIKQLQRERYEKAARDAYLKRIIEYNEKHRSG